MDTVIDEMLTPYTNVNSKSVIADIQNLLVLASDWPQSNSIVLSSLKPSDRGILALEGMGKEIWEDVDVKKYLGELRNEWDR